MDWQLIKYTRPSVDLVYFFGSSMDASFRKKYLSSLLKIYHENLIAELNNFDYKNLYSFDDLMKDFEDTWGFGFVMSCLHIQRQVSKNLY